MKNITKILVPFIGALFSMSAHSQNVDFSKYSVYGANKDSIVVEEISKERIKKYKFVDKDKDGYYEYVSGDDKKRGNEIEKNQRGSYLFSINGVAPGIYVYDNVGMLVKKVKFK